VQSNTLYDFTATASKSKWLCRCNPWWFLPKKEAHRVNGTYTIDDNAPILHFLSNIQSIADALVELECADRWRSTCSHRALFEPVTFNNYPRHKFNQYRYDKREYRLLQLTPASSSPSDYYPELDALLLYRGQLGISPAWMHERKSIFLSRTMAFDVNAEQQRNWSIKPLRGSSNSVLLPVH